MTEVEQQFRGDHPEANGARVKRFNQCKRMFQGHIVYSLLSQ
jgi:hypothetical protein